MNENALISLAGAGLAAAVVIWSVSVLWRRYRAARVPLAIIPIGFGAFFAYGTLSEPYGYIADYGFGAVWVTSALLALGSLFLLLVPRTRHSCWCGFAAAGLVLATFYLLVGAALLFGFRWHDFPLVPVARHF